MINRVVLVGRLTKNPELRYTPNGVAVTSFTIAVNRPFSNQQGERDADFIPVVVWRRQAENAANFLQKGSLAGVDGRIQTRNYENNEGRRVYVTEVVADSVQFLEPKGSRNNNGGNYAPSAPSAPANQQRGGFAPSSNNAMNGAGQDQGAPSFDDPFAGDSKPIDISDDDLPF
ncbi:single-stranded DNA-binding protein [Sporolactobacillus terrae]|uniref:Single-stranded DNA-binding protein n=1 Tax=Sporolactobacillus terrae TaxID=269673 RepID=A0A410DCU6_9BACL|nr:single-stranded DNA-binding protein [Sporolactobacillus terrae]QAA23898.1 single-stranded DNA-binding protein [Sporolactobacillus terrae]QAA26869.1 single-stranded DNA-binding protein [Sporolactobacillus terrae]UAK15928.1 single-stranded DNA-binding protein [Sporolactobacillus terrae]BBO00436.1 single-stranded DNA-binding protein 1 [Sporolactobacillus terrae]